MSDDFEREIDFILWRYFELRLLRREQSRASDDGMPEARG